MDNLFSSSLLVAAIAVITILLVSIIILAQWYHKAKQGQALVKTGLGGTKVSFNGILKIPVLQRLETMDISLKTVVITRKEKDGLICNDNIRADIQVTFFVRVNKTAEDVIQVAQSIGCERASDTHALESLFDAKFSEALKTVGKQFDFVDLYNKRDDFRREILNIIGRDLNGYILDDAAIDFLEQTSLHILNEDNILDAEGIKKITELTAIQKMKSNDIARNKEKTIKRQDVEAREAILELEKQLAETESKKLREIESIKAREEAETQIVREVERQKAKAAQIKADEEIDIANENKDRQVLIAQRSKERTDAIEIERVNKERELEVTERERVVSLAQIEKEKALEVERKNIQEVIRERVAIEKTVVEEQERIKDSVAFATADRSKKVAITNAEEIAQSELVKTLKAAEAQKDAAEFTAKQRMVEAETEFATAGKKADAIKILAEAKAAEHASLGLSEAQVMHAKAAAKEKEGEAEASVIEDRMAAEAKGISTKGNAQAEVDFKLGKAAAEVVQIRAKADEEKGLAEAKVLLEKMNSEAKGIEQKANAMKKLDGIGKQHEEFKLTLEKEKEIELAHINIQEKIAEAQAKVISEALKSAKIDIVGGETMFFDKIVGAITKGKSVDRFVNNSQLIGELKDQLFTSDQGSNFVESIKQLVHRFGISSNDIKNLSISVLLFKMMGMAEDEQTKGFLTQLKEIATGLGIANQTLEDVGIKAQ